MVKKIVKLAFEKAKTQVQNQNKSNLSIHIANELDKKSIQISDKSLLRAYNKYIENLKEVTPSENTINAICAYLGYENYTAFINHYNKEKHLKGKKEKITKVEITNLDTIKVEVINHKTKIVYSIIIVAFVVFGINYFRNNSKQRITSNKVTINNFKTNTNYYYYTSPQGNIEFTDNPNINNTKPLTINVLNSFIKENKIDTTNKTVKLIKAQYYKNGWKDKPLQEVKNINKQTISKLEKTPIKHQYSNIKTLNITIKNNDQIDIQIEKKLILKFKNKYTINSSSSNYYLSGQSNYNFAKSKITKGRIICTLFLKYSIINNKTKNLIFMDIKQVKGTGFSKKTAKQNTINKLKL